MFNQWVLINPLYSYNTGAAMQLLSLAFPCKPSLQDIWIPYIPSLKHTLTLTLQVSQILIQQGFTFAFMLAVLLRVHDWVRVHGLGPWRGGSFKSSECLLVSHSISIVITCRWSPISKTHPSMPTPNISTLKVIGSGNSLIMLTPSSPPSRPLRTWRMPSRWHSSSF